MNEIDWGKAPEGATHYNHTYFDWYKVGSHEPSFWNGRAWEPARFWDDRKHDCIQRPTTPSWTGEGRPPVGVVCEANFVGRWTEFEMRYYGESYVIFKTHYEVQRTRIDFDTCGVKFRPIRTPEQIAADARVAAIDAMVKECPYPGSTSTRLDCAALYDAGYRKP